MKRTAILITTISLMSFSFGMQSRMDKKCCPVAKQEIAAQCPQAQGCAIAKPCAVNTDCPQASNCPMGKNCVIENCVTDCCLKFHPATDAYDGWRLATQAYTFRLFTFFEAVERAESLGLNWIEAYPGQTLSKQTGDVKFGHDMNAQARELVKQKLSGSRVRLINYGVVSLPAEEAECRKVFEFAKEMGIETIVSEPKLEALDTIEKLAQEYQIKVAIHNHPKPSFYWNPDTVLKAIEGRSKLIGACADTGHWMRSGLNPLECIKKLQGRIISLHIKDLNEFDKMDAHDVPWGRGKADLGAVLKELDRQGFKGVFSIEYEHNWENSLPEIRRCVGWFNRTASELSKGKGWANVFNRNLSNAKYSQGTWSWEEGVLTRKGRGDIWTNERFGNFVLDLEFKLVENANSGIFIRTDDLNDAVQTGIEVQILDSTDLTRQSCGAIFDILAPKKNASRPAGQWNRFTITCIDNRIWVVLNNEQVIDMNLNDWTEAGKNPDGKQNKFKTAYKDMSREGHIGLQDHGDQVWFRNIKIRGI